MNRNLIIGVVAAAGLWWFMSRQSMANEPEPEPEPEPDPNRPWWLKSQADLDAYQRLRSTGVRRPAATSPVQRPPADRPPAKPCETCT